MRIANWEIRWFFEGSVPESVMDWGRNMGLDGPTKRKDIYLLFPDCDTLGVKVSRGELQVKYCCSIQEFVSEGIEMSGSMQLWSKCSLPISDSSAIPFDLVNGSQYDLNKESYSKKYEVDLKKERVLPAEARVQEGVIVEITRLTVQQADWWTLGMDVLGTEYINTLNVGTRMLFHGFPEIKLQKTSSYSYPEWLSLIHSKSE